MTQSSPSMVRHPRFKYMKYSNLHAHIFLVINRIVFTCNIKELQFREDRNTKFYSQINPLFFYFYINIVNFLCIIKNLSDREIIFYSCELIVKNFIAKWND